MPLTQYRIDYEYYYTTCSNGKSSIWKTQVQSSIGHVHVQTGQGHVPKHPEVDGRGLYVSLHVRITDIILEKLWPLH